MSASALQLNPANTAQNQATVNLRRGSLGLSGLAAQSVAGLAPSTSISVPIVVVAILCGNGAWLVWTISTLVMLAIALSMAWITRHYASSGGLYALNACGHPLFGAITALVGMLSCLAGVSTSPLLFAIFLQSFLGDLGLHCSSPVLLACMILCTSTAGLLAWRDTAMSARLVLAIEGLSLVAIITLVMLVLLRHTAPLVDTAQLTLQGVTAHQIAEGIVLGLGAFTGFEASCSFGLEARQPHRQIAQSLVGSVLGAGLLFVLCSYVLKLGFHGINIATSHSSNPWSDLAVLYGGGVLRYIVQIGVLISVFSMFVTNFNVWSRMLMTLSREGLMPGWLGTVDHHTRTPGKAILASVLFGVALQILTVVTGYASRNLYTLVCALTGYWVTVTYILTCISVLLFLRKNNRLHTHHILIAAIGSVPLALSILLSAFPLPPFPDDIGVILFVLSSLAIALQMLLLHRRYPHLLERFALPSSQSTPPKAT